MINFEVLGIIATLFIVVAFAQSGELQIRFFDLMGASLFVVYGILIKSFSTVLLNVVLVIIQIYKIMELRKVCNEN